MTADGNRVLFFWNNKNVLELDKGLVVAQLCDCSKNH